MSFWADPNIQLLLDAMPDAIIVVNREGQIVAANVQADKMFGYSRKQLTEKSFDEIVPPRFRAQHELHVDTFFGSSQSRPMGGDLQLLALRGDGTELFVDISLNSYTVDSTPFAVAALRDVTERKRIEAQNTSATILRESEKRFRLLVDNAPTPIWLSGLDKQCTYFNQTWLEFTGRSMEEELGNGWTEGVHPEDLQTCLNTYTQAFDRREKFRMYYRVRRYDGEYRWILDVGVPTFDDGGVFSGYMGIAVDVTEHKEAKGVLASMSSRLIEAQEKERARISRELHDDVGQRLALLAVAIDKTELEIPDQTPEIHAHMQQLHERAVEISSDVMGMAHELHPPKLQYLGLATAMRGFCRDFSEQKNVEIMFDNKGIPDGVPHNVSLCLFRVLQEALHNAAKHSGTVQVKVQLWSRPDEVGLTVSDSGVGFDVEDAKRGAGLGLISMQERVQLVNGIVSIDSRPQRGTTIHARVPLQSKSGSAGKVVGRGARSR